MFTVLASSSHFVRAIAQKLSSFVKLLAKNQPPPVKRLCPETLEHRIPEKDEASEDLLSILATTDSVSRFHEVSASDIKGLAPPPRRRARIHPRSRIVDQVRENRAHVYPATARSHVSSSQQGLFVSHASEGDNAGDNNGASIISSAHEMSQELEIADTDSDRLTT
jgi:hypothetical protein